MVIRTKKKKLVPFVPNEVQCKYLDELCPNWRDGDYTLTDTKEIILKARQFGFSTLIAAIFFCNTLNEPNTTTVVMAHDRPTTEILFRMVRTFYDNLPAHKKPRTQYASKREYFWPDINSTYFVGTAGSGGFGRSMTINNLHASETAFYADPETLMTGLLQAVPEGGNVFIESTANGLGNWYHREYEAAVDGESSYVGRFYAWHQHPEYTSDPAKVAPFESAAELAKELALKAAFGLTDGQLAWRRRKIREPGMRSKFVQEYPASAHEAFIASGHCYFDREVLDARKVILAGRPEPDRPVIPHTFPKLALESGLKVFKAPERGRRYVIGADVAEGLTKSSDPDYSCADVLDWETLEQVATLHGRWEPHVFALLLYELGGWYNDALIAPERNNHGHAVIVTLRHICGLPDKGPYDWGGLYLHSEYDQATDQTTLKPGWATNVRTRPLMLDKLAQGIVEGAPILNDVDTVKEMNTFVHLPGGKSGGEPGCHDDRVFSLAIALAVRLLTPEPSLGVDPTHYSLASPGSERDDLPNAYVPR